MKSDTKGKPVAWAAVVIALLSLVLSMTGVSDAVRQVRCPGASTKPKPYGVLRLNKKKKFPPSAIPKVRAARRADRLGGKRLRDLTARCAPDTRRPRHAGA